MKKETGIEKTFTLQFERVTCVEGKKITECLLF